MHDDITRPHALASGGELRGHPTNIAGNGAGAERRALSGFTQLLPLGVHQRRAEILRLADDTRVSHTHQLIAHLHRDLFQSPEDHTCGYWVNCPAFVGHRTRAALHSHAVPPTVTIRLPCAS